MKEKVILDDGDIAVLDLFEDPVVFGEFVRSTDEEIDEGGSWSFNNYQKLMILDESPYVSVCTGRTTGKTVSLETKIIHNAVSNKYVKASANEVVLVVQNKAQLEPIFLRLTQFFRRHKLLKNFVDRTSINFSEHLIKLLNGATIRCRIVGSSADSNIIGLHTPCILVDEAQVFNYVAWNSLGQCLTQWDEGYQMWLSGVPNGLREKNILYEADQLDSRWSRYNVSRLQSPRYSKDQHKSDLKQYGGEEGDDYVHLVCFPEGTPIVSREGTRDISEIRVGDYVLDAGGHYTRVIDTHKNYYSGDLVGIKVFGDYRTYYSTPEHPILSTRIDKCHMSGSFEWKCWYSCGKKNCYNKLYKNYSTDFCNAKDITKWHRLHYPIVNSIDKEYINISDFVGDVVVINDFVRITNGRTKSGKYINSNKLKGDITNRVCLDSDFMSVLGWYLAEGSAVRGNCLQFSFHKKERPIADHIAKYFKGTFNVGSTISNGNGNGIYLKIYNTILCSLFTSLCGVHSWGKSVSSTILNLGAEKIKVLLESYFKGDGHRRAGERSNEESCTTVSYKLANDIRFMMFKVGIFTSISTQTNKKPLLILNNKNLTNPRDSYNISFVHDSNRKYINNDYYTIRVRDIVHKSFSGEVYNLQTESGTYCLPSYAVHNCGEHGSPAFSVFDRKLMKIENYEVTLGLINNLTLEQAGGKFNEILRAPDMIGIDADLIACYSSDTEVLTSSGWKLFKDLLSDDKVATLIDNKLEYQNYTNYICYHYSGKMFSAQSRFIDLLVTPNHNLYVSHKKRGSYINNRFGLVEAEEVFDESIRFKNTCEFDGTTLNCWTIPGYSIFCSNRWGTKNNLIVDPMVVDAKAFVEFMGYFISEGSLGKGKVVISQSRIRHIDNYDKICKCVDKLLFKYTTSDDAIVINNTQLQRYLSSFGMFDSYHKHIPRELLSLSYDLLVILFKALMLGDGYVRDNTYSTCSKQLANDFQELLLRLGMSGVVSYRDNREKGNYLCDRKVVTRGLTYVVNFQTKYLNPTLNTRGLQHTAWVDYNDSVYCVTVPNHVIMVRRNGKPVWCGNCAVDAGFSNDPTIITILYRCQEIWRIFLRYELRRIKYPTQAKIINWLDNIYGFNMITLDAGSSGLALGQMLQDLEEFKGKDYQKRLTLVDFQGGVVTGYDEEGKEIKDRVRKFTIQTLQKWSQNDHLIVFSDRDDEMISELERVGFTRDMLGQPKFFVYSPSGGQRGDDHILASLLTWVYGYYYEYYSPGKPGKGKYKDLAQGGWNMG